MEKKVEQPSTTLKKERILSLNDRVLQEIPTGPVMYWMYRDQRVHDNAAVYRAQELALSMQRPLIVVVSLRDDLRKASGTARWFEPMALGLQKIAVELQKINIAFIILYGDPLTTIPHFIESHDISAVVCDFSPLRIPRSWQSKLAKQSSIPWECVDAHNIVPVWTASPKQEFAARTFRPKIHALLPDFMEKVPRLSKHAFSIKDMKLQKLVDQQNPQKIQDQCLKKVKVDATIKSVDWFVPGEEAALDALSEFIAERLSGYDLLRNDPTKKHISNLSPYLHFGYLSPLRMLHELQKAPPSVDRDAFIEESVVRRELSDNYCFYNDMYDSLEGAPKWAQKTLREHEHDQRDFIYEYQTFAQAQTHDAAWNAAQNQLLKTGKMHGYMRMYWAKKILEWTKNPQEAITIAIKLNDLYEIDGRDPNGYTGIMWSIAGVHDRAWFERPVFGKVRYMNANGLKKKFDIDAYIQTWNSADTEAS